MDGNDKKEEAKLFNSRANQWRQQRDDYEKTNRHFVI